MILFLSTTTARADFRIIRNAQRPSLAVFSPSDPVSHVEKYIFAVRVTPGAAPVSPLFNMKLTSRMVKSNLGGDYFRNWITALKKKIRGCVEEIMRRKPEEIDT